MPELTTAPAETVVDPANDYFYMQDVSETPDAINRVTFNSMLASRFLSAYQAADASYTTDNSLNDTDLNITAAAGKVYKFEIWAPASLGAGGIKWAFGGTASFTTFDAMYTLLTTSDALGDNIAASGARIDNPTSAFEISSFTGTAFIKIVGSFEINAGGTVIFQCSQRNSDAAATVFGKNAVMTAMQMN